MSNTIASANWWERQGNFVAYAGQRQENLPHCVYAAIAGGINYLARREVWTAQSLYHEHQEDGPKQPDFNVVNLALVPVAGEIEKRHHLRNTPAGGLSPSLLRNWIIDGAVVILSMQLSDGGGGRLQRWHMFSLVALDGDLFQVWDTNGGQIMNGVMFEGRGLLNEEEISSKLRYPNGWIFLPHLDEDTLVLKRRK